MPVNAEPCGAVGTGEAPAKHRARPSRGVAAGAGTRRGGVQNTHWRFSAVGGLGQASEMVLGNQLSVPASSSVSPQVGFRPAVPSPRPRPGRLRVVSAS